MYCTYLTIYYGNLLPRRYIGSSSVSSVRNGYNGSVASIKWGEIYEKEQKDNRHLFKTRVLTIHSTREEALEKELEIQIKYDVVKSDLYMNESLAKPNGSHGRDVSGKNNPMYGRDRKGETHKGGENISKALKEYYSTEDGKASIDAAKATKVANGTTGHGRKASDETKKKMSDSRTGELNGMFGRTHTPEARAKISKSRKGKPSPNKGKKMSEEQKVKMRKPKTEEHKEKLRGPRTEEQKEKLRNWYLIDGVLVKNLSAYCEARGYGTAWVADCARNNKPYRGMEVKLVRQVKKSKIEGT